MKHAYLLASLLAALALPLKAESLDLAGLRADEVALWVGRVGSPDVLAEHRADVAVNPASTMKLVTSFAALETLGPAWRWHSDLLASAPIVGDTLQGDLVWLGRGDPLFDLPALDALLGELRLRGVTRISGRLVLDKGAFSGSGSADDFDADAERAFAVAPDTHLTHLKVAWLHYYNEGGAARVVLEPALSGVTLLSELSDGGDRGESRCGDVRRRVEIRQQGSQIRVSGSLPRVCDGASSFVNVLSADDYAAQAFAARWARLGGLGPAGFAVGRTPVDARRLARYSSPPLVQALAAINQYSNNTMARSLFLTLGAERPVSGDTIADARRVVGQVLAANSLDGQGLVLENGAGLSRRERVSARELGELLRAAARSPYAAEFIASLPVAGASGTLKQRLGQWGPRLRLKTGTLSGVRALAGYWLAPDGERLAIVAIINSSRASELQPNLDALLDGVLARYARIAAAS
ncbi:D-alanyl-D-alanine carboxypeptidase/D-alanyl-D-alanine endopeptidase [Craterilacuibacter sp.]|uniref:D-alanyl-D-alanine carboxypeptidase/D-alanyl-D-alanine endopeptidase n=1 Tax=Craterilacuibacter sp. TaxID=2870909 RepID=UPI003F2A7072